ncbi:SGNH/GDSL hydrolase family protein [Noviherbaspirillum massiliense]|uniref:SGNH/GDSL hydrolase family protein n=1 Tax=Noviherbaspirillum massiliense TaxID=1465823 RepID=UPI0003052053|nr:SGNH/GDSL hydrolase family protein [Noviherbaspirillum massiliense]
MKQFTFPSLLALTVILAACGGGGGSSDSNTSTNSSGGTTSNPQPTKLVDAPQVIEYYGDSTIWGYESFTGNRVATPAPDAFAQALPSNQQVRNLGVSGQTACQLLNADGGWDAKMSASQATVVILNHGINDFGSEVGEDIPTYKNCLRTLASIAKTKGKRVIFETPNPVDRDGLQNYVAAMKEVAAESSPALSVIDQFSRLNQFLLDGSRNIRDMCPDGTHPSQAVYVEKGQYAAQVYKTLSK